MQAGGRTGRAGELGEEGAGGAAAGPEAVAAASHARGRLERHGSGELPGLTTRTVEDMMEAMIEQAYAEDGLEVFCPCISLSSICTPPILT